MFGSNALEFAIGMIFVYLLLSLLCSALNESIESKLKNRAKDLERGIKEMLIDQQLVQKVYDHSLVASLFKASYDQTDKTNLPSYIPARNFALVLMDIALPAEGGKSGAAGATAPPDSSSGPRVDSTKDLRDGISANIKQPDVQKALLTLVDAAGGNVNKARENIEDWFNTSMDRVSGWYKRRSHQIILALGVVVTVGMNADTITIAQHLVTDDTLRKTLAAEAEAYAKKPETEKSSDTDAHLKQIKGEIEKLGLPIGWHLRSFVDDPSGVPFKASATDPARPNGTDYLGWFLKKIAGWLLTAVAISLGAPFWFDLLNKIIVIRSTVKPHEKSPEERSKA